VDDADQEEAEPIVEQVRYSGSPGQPYATVPLLTLRNAPGRAMIQRYELRDEHGRITGFVLRETPNGPRSSGRPSRPRDSESPLVDTICMVAGFIMLAATVALFWLMATAA
jgi:hypothetical protein